MNAHTYTVQGMDCTSCAAKLEKGISKLDGVREVRVDFATGKLHVEGPATPEAIRERVEFLGYQLIEARTATEPPQRGGAAGFVWYLLSRRETQLALFGGVIILLALGGALLGLDETLRDLLFAAAMLVAVYPVARDGLNNLTVNRDFNINLLMTIAAAGALIIGETLEAATVIFLFALGEALEGYTADRARDSLRGLMALAPAQAIRLSACDDGSCEEQPVPVEALRVGDLILVKPGERIAMDGSVAEGESAVNQAPITGESLPVHKSAGDEVFAGTINGAGMLKVRVRRVAADNTLSRIIKLVEEAQSVRAPSQRLIDQFARVYTPAVVVIAALVALGPPLLLGQPFHNTAEGAHGWLYRALALLVISCPCALVISAPVTVISAIAAAARRGVLIKGGAHLEALGTVRTFAFDKTGTLTAGVPVVMHNRAVDCKSDGDDACQPCDNVLALASAVEQRSAHPLARAIVGAAQARGLDRVYRPAEAVEMLAGQGLRGQVNGKTITIGSHRLFDQEYPHQAAFCDLVNQAEAQGQTTMLLSEGDQVRGFIAVADSVRDDSKAVLAALNNLNIRTVMLTGDNARVAKAVGRQVGVADVRADLLPADKVAAIRALAAQGRVAMVGDGVNDTPALAAATVGIAMGGAGSAQALEAADIALMADDLAQLPFAVRLARFARRLIMQNIAFSLGTKLVFMLLAVTGEATMWMAVAADMGVSLAVTLNGMRPLRFGRKAGEPPAI